jgi:outer membrane protein W
LNTIKSLKYVATIAIALIAAQFVGASAAEAQSDNDFRWIVRGHYIHVWPGSDTLRVQDPVLIEPPAVNEFYADGGNGFNAEVEYMIMDNVGVWAGYTFANMKTNLKIERGTQEAYGDDRVDMGQWNLGGNYHFSPNGRMDLYGGILASWVNYSSSTINFNQGNINRDVRIEFDSELSLGLNAGIDFPFTSSGNWVVSGALRYIFLALEGDDNIYALTIDPLQGYIGVGYRF